MKSKFNQLIESSLDQTPQFSWDFYLEENKLTFNEIIETNIWLIESRVENLELSLSQYIIKDKQDRVICLRLPDELHKLDIYYTPTKQIIERNARGEVIVLAMFNDQGHLTYLKKDGHEHHYEYDQQGNSIDQRAIKKAQEYNKLFHGLFFHTVSGGDLEYHLKRITQKVPHELSVCSIRSNILFDTRRVSLIGFGHMLELYDADIRSGFGVGAKKIANQWDTHQTDDNLLKYKVHNRDMQQHDPGYGDEGFMNADSMDCVIAVVPPHKEYPPQFKPDRSDEITLLKKYIPNIKIITLDEFLKLMKSEKLANFVYKTKQERDIELSRQGQLNMYDEKKSLANFNNLVNEVLFL